MGKVVLHMQITFDGIVSDVVEWFTEHHNNEAFSDIIPVYEAADAQLVGFGAYKEMGKHWQNAAVDPQAAPLDAAMGRVLNAKRKIVFSHTEEEMYWENSELRLVKNDEDLAREVTALKKEIDGTMVLSGGANIAQSFARLGLVDEYLLLVHPIVLGKGQRLFEGVDKRQTLKLLDTKTYETGLMRVRYEVR
jgi:dihydrofolate reductase